MTAVGATVAEQRITVGGGDVQYLEAGSGPPLVLLHGDGDSAWDWEGVMCRLGDRYRCIAISFPGHGDTDLSIDATAPAYAEFVRATVDALSLGPVALVGNSLGGLVATEVALAEPSMVTHLVLGSSAGLGPMVNPVLALESLPGIGESAVAATLAPLGTQQRAALRASMLFAQPWRIPPRWWLDQLRLGRRPTFLAASLESKRSILDGMGQHRVVLDRLDELTLPVLVIWGSSTASCPSAKVPPPSSVSAADGSSSSMAVGTSRTSRTPKRSPRCCGRS